MALSKFLMKRKIKFIVALTILAVHLLLLGAINRPIQSKSITLLDRSSCRVTGDKWVVTTVTGLHPKTLENVLNTLDWNLMVLGEKFTPENWSRQFASERLLFLSFQDQLKLDLYSARHISRGLNSQRNIGYLLAIFCGAKVIYELDSNGLIMDSDIQVYPSTQSAIGLPWIAFHLNRSLFVNIYGIFGQPHLWPRGLPVNELKNISEDGWSSLRRNDNEIINAYIQQKLFAFGPDVDALGILTREQSLRHVSFDYDRGPIAVESFTFSPYNSQNTVHTINAFWGLYLPITINTLVSDIWRSFLVQRLLWDIGGNLMFMKSTVKRYQQIENLFSIMKIEQTIYENATL